MVFSLYCIMASGKALCFIYFIMIPLRCILSIQTGHTIPKGDACAKTKSRAVYPGGRAAAQLLIPAAWGVFQQPVMQGYGFSAGRLCWGLRCWSRPMVWAARWAGFAGRPRSAFRRVVGHGPIGGRVLRGGVRAARQRRAFLVVYSVPAGWAVRFGPGSAGVCAEVVSGQKGWATGVAGVAMGLSGAFLRCSSGVSTGCGASAFALRRWGWSCSSSAVRGR